MSKKQYTVTTIERAAQPRSKRRQGGASSTGGGGVAFYEVEMNADTGAMTLSATYSELLEKMESGAVCYGVLSEEGFGFMQLPIFCLTPGDKYYTYRAVLYKAIPEWEMVVFESETDDANMVYTPN